MILSITRIDFVQNIPNIPTNNKMKQPYEVLPPKIINSEQGFNKIYYCLSKYTCMYLLSMAYHHATYNQK